MVDIVRPWSTNEVSKDWPDQIEQLYSQSDRQAADASLPLMDRRPLSNAEDIALMDDLMDALIDPLQAKISRPVLRHALKDIAKAALAKQNCPTNL